jgi:hypothetical protein
MKIKITESQFIKIILNEKKVELSEQGTYTVTKNSGNPKPLVKGPTINKAISCGYKSLNSYKKNNFKCPSKFLQNAIKCGWKDILKYEASNFRCDTKRAFLSPEEYKKYNEIRQTLGISTGFEKYDPLNRELINRQDRPDLVMKQKGMCKPFCVSKEISCFIWFVRENKEKIKQRLGGGISESNLEMLVKIAMGILAWQSNYGTIDRLYDIEPQKILGIEINPYDVYNKPGGARALKQYAKHKDPKTPKEPSFGPAEFKISKFEETGVQKDFGKGIETVIGSGLAVMIVMWQNYLKTKSLGLSSGPSRNDIAKNSGFWKDGVKGTGNHLWDLTISTHTWPKEKMLKKYCKTDDPMFAAPCDLAYYSPFTNQETWEKWKNSTQEIKNYYFKTKKKFPGKIKVHQSEPILDYYPMLRGAHGDSGAGVNDSKTMVEFVAKKIAAYNCVDLTGYGPSKPVVNDRIIPSSQKAGIYTA